MAATHATPNLDVRFRRVFRSDLDAVEDLHIECLPVRYGATFYNRLVSPSSGINCVIAVARVPNMENAENKSAEGKNSEDKNAEAKDPEEARGELLLGVITTRTIDSKTCDEREFIEGPAKLLYIMTLVVRQRYRRCGVASSLLQRCIQPQHNSPICKAVYLHVIIHNEGAIGFYERNDFQCMARRRNFYCIEGQRFDSFVYMLHINGGTRPSQAPSGWRCCLL